MIEEGEEGGGEGWREGRRQRRRRWRRKALDGRGNKGETYVIDACERCPPCSF